MATILKFNPYHDDSGRFTSADNNTTGSGGGVGLYSTKEFAKAPLREQVKAVYGVSVGEGEPIGDLTPQVFTVEWDDGSGLAEWSGTYEEASPTEVEFLDSAIIAHGINNADYDVKSISGDHVTFLDNDGAPVKVTRDELFEGYNDLLVNTGYMDEDPADFMGGLVNKIVEDKTWGK